MKKIVAIWLITTFIIIGCVPTQKPIKSSSEIAKTAPKDCNFSSIQGKEFVFRDQSPSLQQYGYQQWQKEPDSVRGERLSFAGYVNKHGKLKEQLVNAKFNGKLSNEYMFIAVTEKCETIYSDARGRTDKKQVSDLERSTGIYFIETLENAKSLIGKEIWAKVSFGNKNSTVLYTPDPKISYPIGNLERLHVVNIDTTQYGHTFGAPPLFLVVKTESGNEGLMPYLAREFHDSNPIDSSWDKATVDLLINQQVKIGMSEEQVLISWGEPKKNNKTVGSYGVHEQWVYGNGQYLYFENNVLTTLQTSQ